MSDLRKAAQQALEALEAGPDVDPIFAGETQDALRAALAQQPDPVWVKGELPPRYIARSPIQPEPVQEPVAPAMRDAAVYGVGISRDGKRIDPASIYAQPAQKPYCHVYEYDSPLGIHRTLYPKEHNGKQPDRAIPLYTAPPQRPPLTDEEIDRLWRDPQQGYWDYRKFARAVERKVRGETE